MKDRDQKHYLVILQKPLLDNFCLNPVLCLEKKLIIVMTLGIINKRILRFAEISMFGTEVSDRLEQLILRWSSYLS